MQLSLPSIRPPFALLLYEHTLIGGKIGVAASRSSSGAGGGSPS
jgi:hypothetical protein